MTRKTATKPSTATVVPSQVVFAGFDAQAVEAAKRKAEAFRCAAINNNGRMF